MPPRHEVGDSLRTLHRKQGISQGTLAARSGISLRALQYGGSSTGGGQLYP